MLRFCRFLEYNFIILKYACVTDLSCNSHTSPAKIEKWRFSSNFKFQRGFLHVSSHTVFKVDYLHNLDQNECVHQIPLLHFAKSSLSCSWLFSAYCSWIICIPFLQLFHLTFSFVGYFLLFAKIALGYHDWPRDHVNQKPS